VIRNSLFQLVLICQTAEWLVMSSLINHQKQMDIDVLMAHTQVKQAVINNYREKIINQPFTQLVFGRDSSASQFSKSTYSLSSLTSPEEAFTRKEYNIYRGLVVGTVLYLCIYIAGYSMMWIH
jgi:hypothetical protein